MCSVMVRRVEENCGEQQIAGQRNRDDAAYTDHGDPCALFSAQLFGEQRQRGEIENQKQTGKSDRQCLPLLFLRLCGRDGVRLVDDVKHPAQIFL